MDLEKKENISVEEKKSSFSFPGPWFGGISMIISPILLLIGEFFKIKYNYYFPYQLQGYAEHPVLMTISYSCFTLSFILMWPAIFTLTNMIGEKKPGWAKWGGTLAIIGLFVRLFHEGVNHQAFQLVDVQNLEMATHAVKDSYTAWYVLYPLVFADNYGWIVLGIGAYLSGTLGWFSAFALAAMSNHNSGVLKGTDIKSFTDTLFLCIAFLPLGIRVLRNCPKPSRRAFKWAIPIVLIIAYLYYRTLTNSLS